MITPSLLWALRHGACFSGRRRLGRLSIRNYWIRMRDIDSLTDLEWIAIRLGREMFADDSAKHLQYTNALDAAYEAQRGQPYRIEKTRARLTQVMVNFGIKWPTEIL